jgi:hypothetical protein
MPTPLQAGRMPGEDLDLSLDDMVDLLSREIERLKVSLEMYRLLDHPQKQDIIRRHVSALDERQDRLDELKDLLLARRTPH